MDRRRIIGIDIGTESVKILTGMTDKAGGINITGSGAAPTVGFVKGVITDTGALAYTVKQALDCVIMTTTEILPEDQLYIGISGEHIGSHHQLADAAKADTITEKIPGAEAKVTVENDMAELADGTAGLVGTADLVEPSVPSIEHRVLHDLSDFCQVTAPAQALSEFVAAMTGIGVQADGIVVNGVVSAWHALAMDANQLESAARTLFIDIGAGTLDLVVCEGGVIQAVNCLPLGGEYITKDIMQGIGVNRAHAEEIKRYYSRLDKQFYGRNIVLDCNDYGTTDKNIPYDFLYDIVESRVEEIVQLTGEQLQLLLPVGSQSKIERVLLTGGCGAMPSVGDFMAKFFATQVQVVQPQGTLPEYARPSLWACIGILEYGLRQQPSWSVATGGAWTVLKSSVRRIFGR